MQSNKNTQNVHYLTLKYVRSEGRSEYLSGFDIFRFNGIFGVKWLWIIYALREWHYVKQKWNRVVYRLLVYPYGLETV